jgi:hypothetical protein
VCRGRSRSLSRSSLDARRRAPRRARATIHPALERVVQQVVYREEKEQEHTGGGLPSVRYEYS